MPFCSESLCSATKYGALSVPEGRIEMVWSIGNDDAVSFSWIERNGPIVEEPTRCGFGSRFILEVLVADANWNARLDYEPSGLRCTINIHM